MAGIYTVAISIAKPVVRHIFSASCVGLRLWLVLPVKPVVYTTGILCAGLWPKDSVSVAERLAAYPHQAQISSPDRPEKCLQWLPNGSLDAGIRFG